jgi:hypothetical protein
MGTAGLFERLAARYDAWYDGPAGPAVFPSEVACLRPLLRGLPRPWAEVGVGSGRFAAALGVDVGLDPAATPLALARSRKTPARKGRCSPTPRMTHTPYLTGHAYLGSIRGATPTNALRSTAAPVATGPASPWKRHP